MIKKILGVFLLLLTMSACTPTQVADLDFNVESLNDIDYSNDYLYYNISYEDVTFESIDIASDILLLIDITVENGLSSCIWKESHFQVIETIYGEYDSNMSIIKYPIEYYDIESNELRAYPAISSGLYLIYLQKNEENEYRITNNFNGLIKIENNEIYNYEVKINSILKYFIVENPLVIENEQDYYHMSTNSYDDMVFNSLEFQTINNSTISFDYFYDQNLDKSYILLNGILFESLSSLK